MSKRISIPEHALQCADGAHPDFLLPTIERLFHECEGFEENIEYHSWDTDCFFPLQRRRELAAMMETASSLNPAVIMEVGTANGAGLVHWCLLPNMRRICAIEIRGTPYMDIFERTFPHIDFLWVAASSHAPEIVAQVKDWLGPDKFDCIFLDGEKSKFLEDFNAYAPSVHKGGMVFMHDIAGAEPPAREFRRLQCVYPTSTIINVTEVHAIAQRKPLNAYEDWVWRWGYNSCGVGIVHV